MMAGEITAKASVERSSSSGSKDDPLVSLQDSWMNAEYFLFFRVCQIFVCFRKHTAAVKLRTYMTRWRFHCHQERKVHAVVEASKDMTSVQAHRSSFLAALADHDALLGLMVAERDNFQEKMYQHTVIGGAKMFITFWRCRVVRRLGLAFQKWYLEMKHSANTKTLERLLESQKRGTDELNDRQTKSREIEELNSRLQLSLLVVLSVLRLRTHSKLMNLCSSLEHDAKIRKQLFNEVVCVKDALKRYRTADILATTTALERGKECMESLKSTHGNVQVAREAHNKLRLMSEEINKIQRDLQNSKDIRDRNAGISSNSMGLGGGIAPTASSASKGRSNDTEMEEAKPNNENKDHEKKHHHRKSHNQEKDHSQKKVLRRASGASTGSATATVS